MVIKTVRDYLSQVAPVPYDEASFSHTTKVEQHFENVPAYRNYKLFVNDKAVVRPYTDDVQVSLNVRDRIHDVELFELGDAASPLARGWYAVTDYKGSLPVSVAMRGVRVRHGNIEVGDEYFLSAAYLERRFATWMIGEIQICNRNIRPNARRDGFEQTSEYELFLEQTNALGRFLSRLCRKSSSQRCAAQGAAQQLHEIESSLQDLAFFIDEEHKESFLDTMQLKVQRIQDLAETSGDGQHVMNKRQELQSRMESLSGSFSLLRNHIDREVLRCFDSTQVLEIIIKNLHKEYPNSNSFEGLIRKILLPFIKSSPL
jgi:molecular chaperone HtpG